MWVRGNDCWRLPRDEIHRALCLLGVVPYELISLHSLAGVCLICLGWKHVERKQYQGVVKIHRCS